MVFLSGFLALMVFLSGCGCSKTQLCGDGICDQNEINNPRLCPRDCETVKGQQKRKEQAAGPDYYFIAIHNEPYHDQELDLAENYAILKEMIKKADEYNIKLTLMFSPQWADLIQLDDLEAWKDRGHEIAAHHHSIYHGSWDGYTNYSREKMEELRKKNRVNIITRKKVPVPETYLGTLDDFMEKLKKINPEMNSGCVNEEGDKNAMPDGIIYGTCSGYANFGTPGTRIAGDAEAQKGKNDFVTAGTVKGITRKWLAHYQIFKDEKAGETMFSSMDSGAYGVVAHSSRGDADEYYEFLEFLHKKDPGGGGSKTVSEIIEGELLPEEQMGAL